MQDHGRRASIFFPDLSSHTQHLIDMHINVALATGRHNQSIPTGDVVYLNPNHYEKVVQAIRQAVPIAAISAPHNQIKLLYLAGIILQMGQEPAKPKLIEWAEEFGIDSALLFSVSLFLESLESVNNYHLPSGKPFSLKCVQTIRDLRSIKQELTFDLCLQAICEALRQDRQTLLSDYQRVLDVGKGYE
jgi:hypothetical protein